MQLPGMIKKRNTALCMLSVLLMAGSCFLSLHAQEDSLKIPASEGPIGKGNAGEVWEARWITAFENQNESNTWICFRREFEVPEKPGTAVARIAVDSKYWLWINGEMAVFEGGLKRGPTPGDTYYDEVDLAPFLNEGRNTVALLVWYFGKDGFSHKSSGIAGMVFECNAETFRLHSDRSWLAAIHPAYEHMEGEKPNFRLPESNIRFDARKDLEDWYSTTYRIQKKYFKEAVELGKPPLTPWNKLVCRPIPHWRNYGLKDYISIERTNGDQFDTLHCSLPYNAQVTPWLRLRSDAGQTISILTDHYRVGNIPSVRAEYITMDGLQEYESLGWMNGHHMFYIVPSGTEVERVMYRETGFDCDFSGSFSCNDPFYNRLWQKAARTLYITMRDTYMDCPERERAQWWGDVVNESGMAFYALDPGSASLTKKGILELINWQRPDSTLFSPIPAGNWNQELPGQMLASVGYFGFWNYYLNTGDLETMKQVYPGIKKYLDIWKLKEDGILEERTGDWYWGDHGELVDRQLLFNAWYYLALKGYRNISAALGEKDEADRIQHRMDGFRKAFNSAFWDGKGYRTSGYEGKYDDRAQALTVVAGLADREQFPPLLEIFKNSFLASPYMEKYVVEALFLMGEPGYGLERLKTRFGEMVNDESTTTLRENWSDWGTLNHAWSGGGLTILSQYVAGIYPIEPGYSRFGVNPRLGGLREVQVTVPSVSGKIELEITRSARQYNAKISIPENSVAEVYIPSVYGMVKVNKQVILNRHGEVPSSVIRSCELRENHHVVELKTGEYLIEGMK
jgi:alpha-L-rhamnosidase